MDCSERAAKTPAHPPKRVKLSISITIDVDKLYTTVSPTLSDDHKTAGQTREKKHQENSQTTSCTAFIHQVSAFAQDVARAVDDNSLPLVFSAPVPKAYMGPAVKMFLTMEHIDHLRVKLQGEKGTVLMVEDMADWESLPSDAMYVGWTVFFYATTPSALNDDSTSSQQEHY